MAVTSTIAGRDVEFVGRQWVYVDDGEPVHKDRPCEKCAARKAEHATKTPTGL